MASQIDDLSSDNATLRSHLMSLRSDVGLFHELASQNGEPRFPYYDAGGGPLW